MKPADPHKHILGNRLKKAVSILFAALFVIPVSGCILQNPLGLKDYEITVLNDTDGSKNREGYEEIFYWEQPYTVKITVEPNDVDVYWSCDGAANPKFDYDRATESLVRRREVDLKFNGKGTGWVRVSCHNSNSEEYFYGHKKRRLINRRLFFNYNGKFIRLRLRIPHSARSMIAILPRRSVPFPLPLSDTAH